MSRTDDLRRSLTEMAHTPNSAREVLSASIGSDPYVRLQELSRLGQLLAEREGVAYQLEKETKPLLATLATEYAVAHAKSNLSEAKLDRMAKADQRYLNHIKGTAEAIRQREQTKNEFWAIKSELEWDRTAIAHLNSLTRLEQ
tara:strand:+ start:911 stop:1339 length:429 start_codon:yes stop_codon:yes gene_type:complete